MATTIICPNCQHQFEPTDAMREELEKKLNEQSREWRRKKEEEFRLREEALQQQLLQKDAEAVKMLEQERHRVTEIISEQVRSQVASDYEMQMKIIKDSLAETDEKLKLSRRKEAEFLKKEQDLLTREKELQLELQRMLLEERAKISEQIRKQEEDKNRLRDQEHQMKVRELEKQLEDQRRLAEEMKRRAEQGSMQLQGEVQELALEQLLRVQFPFDVVQEVGKGVRGADCVQTVRNSFGQECGRIIYESKRTQDFGKEWIEKLKENARNTGADVAVIVTKTMPRDMDCFGEKDGVWICSFGEVKALAAVLRDLIIRVYTVAKADENKGDKMSMLYSYLTGNEFSAQWRAIREGFMNMRLSIQRERDQMEKLWKAREKQLEKVLLSAAHIKGSIEGIAGNNVDLNLTEGEDEDYLLQ